MTPAGWIVVGVLVVAVLWLGLAAIGAVREIAALRERVDALEAAEEPVHLDAGLPVGTRAPGWRIRTPEGADVTADVFIGRRHVLVFADRDCAACDGVVPGVVAAALRAELPAVVVLCRGPEATPSSWLGDGRTVVTGSEDGSATAAFRVDVSPHVFVVDEGGWIVAQGGALDAGDVRSLVRASDGIRVVSSGTGDD